MQSHWKIHFVWGLTFVLVLLTGYAAWGQDDLETIFQNPPEEAKPRGYWIWAHGNYDYATIKKELKAFREMGLGGVDIFDMGISDPYDIIPPGNTFMGEEMLDGIAFALREAKKLNLAMGLSVSNGWNAGGDWTEPDEKLMRLLFWKDTLRGPVQLSEIGFPEVPTTFEKPYGSYDLFPEFDAEGFPVYYENVALIAYPLRQDQQIRNLKEVRYFDPAAIEGNRVDIELPPGEWVLARAVVTPLGQKMWVRSDNSNGYIMDHYSKKATKHHFEHIIGKLEERMGDLGESSLERLYLASFEAEDYIIWSPELQETFYAQHGYRIDPYIPALAGQVVVDEETTERFLYDYRLTVSEMFVNNHYRQGSAICREHGLLLASESGGPGVPLHYVPTEDLKALGAVDIMRGEFWNMPKRWDDKNGNDLLQVVKNIGSAAHIYGRKIVEMEAFTSQRKHWQESPFELKPIADRAFCEGMTRVVYHTMPHSPPEAGTPGWSYQAGTHIHPKMTWWSMSKSFHAYLARCGAMLMQGRFVADAAYYYGSEIPNFALAKYVRPDLGPGYDYDDLNTEVLLQVTEVRDGRVVLPSGMEYEVLVLPEDDRLELAVLEKVEELLRKGATIIGPKPTRVYGLSGYEEKEQALKQLADRIWGRSDKTKAVDRAYGEGRIVWGKTAREVLLEKGVTPDVQYPGQAEKPVLDYIHRTTGEEDIYFIRNRDSAAVNIEVLFRARGMQPERWDPVSGERHSLAAYRREENGTRLPIQLEAHGSVFVVFRREEAQMAYIERIVREGETIFPGADAAFQALRDEEGRMLFHADDPGSYMLTLNNGQTKTVEIDDNDLERTLTQSWDVRFPYGWGAEPLQQFDELIDWTTAGDPGLKFFSGTATYRTTFDLPDETIDGVQYYLDLGRVGETARVFLNGYEVGVSLFPPHRLDITEWLQPGENRLVVEVANTWRNRLIGDLNLPLDRQYTRSNVGSVAGPTYRPWRDMDPLPSGLMGPVRIVGRRDYVIHVE